MTNRFQFLKDFISQLEINNIKYVFLRNQIDVLKENEKDVDLLCSASSYALIQRVFSKLCSENDRIAQTSMRGKSLFLSASVNGFSHDSVTFSRDLIFHFVSFASIRDSHLKVKIPGYSRRFYINEIEPERFFHAGFVCWIPSNEWLLLLLIEKMQYKRKQVYKEEILRLIDETNKIKENKFLVDEILKSLDENSTKHERLLPVKKMLRTINYKKQFLTPFKEWLSLIFANLKSKARRKGLIITFSGPDGAGKTTTKSNLIKFLEHDVALKVNSIKGFNRLNEPKYMGTAITKVQKNVRGVNHKSASELEHAYRDRKPKKKSSFSWKSRRFIGLLFILIQYPFFYFIGRVRTYLGVTTVVDTSVFDRFVKAHRPRFKVLETIFTPILPSGDITFRLYASPEVINKRKPELTIHELQEYYKVMDSVFSLKKSSIIEVIETESGQDNATKKVNQIVMNKLGHCQINHKLYNART
jgi:hypothetical protein